MLILDWPILTFGLGVEITVIYGFGILFQSILWCLWVEVVWVLDNYLILLIIFRSSFLKIFRSKETFHSSNSNPSSQPEVWVEDPAKKQRVSQNVMWPALWFFESLSYEIKNPVWELGGGLVPHLNPKS